MPREHHYPTEHSITTLGVPLVSRTDGDALSPVALETKLSASLWQNGIIVKVL